jgi:hypothetical protein
MPVPPIAVAAAVALGRASGGPLMRAGADVRGRLRIDHGLQHPSQQPAHQLTAVGGAEHPDHLEQGRIVQGHRVSPSP